MSSEFELLRRLHWDLVSDGFSADGGTLAGVTLAASIMPIQAWDAGSGALLGQWGMTNEGDGTSFLSDVAISASGDLVAAVGYESPYVALVRPRSGTLQWQTPTTDDNNAGFQSVAVSPDGTRVVVGSSYRGSPPDGVVTHGVTVIGADGSPVARLAGFRESPSVFLDDRTLLRGEGDGVVSVWCLP